MRIGLIAMSGIRVCDAELLRLGLTLPGFVERSRTIASLPSLGLLTLAGLTPAEHECEYLEVDAVPEAPPDPARFDLVAISSFSARIGDAYALADRYRAADVPVVLGGLHVTALPEEAAAHADAVVVGEGEPVWPALVADAARRRLQPVYRSDGRYPLAESPLPAFELLEPDRYNRLTVQASRGCPYRCEFCASSILLTPKYKQKPAARVLAEIDRIREIWPQPFVELADDNAFVDRRYWKRLLPELARRSVRWFAETDLSVHEDRELLALMRDSGCREVLIGFESPDAAGLAGIELTSDWKRRRWSEYGDAIARIQSHGIRVNGCFVLGLDAHTTGVFEDVHDFAVATELFDVQVTVLTPFPGTPLHRRLRREGRLLHDRRWERCTLFDINYRPLRMTVDELHQGFRDLAGRLYSDEATRRRRARFRGERTGACGSVQEART